MKIKDEWRAQGFIDEPAAPGTDLKAEIRRLCREKEAIVLAHYYTTGDIQEVADFVGDSLALARKAAQTDARVIVMCGVHFMAETCKLLSPEKMVICPDLNAGCSLADSCRAEDLRRFKEEHPDHLVVSYVNTTAAVKALTDVVVTSGNAKKVVDQLPRDAKIIFGPDYNLGAYINSVTGRDMLLWQGGCHVHERFSVEAIVALKKEYPDAVVMAHLECKGPVLALADVKGSTADMLSYARQCPAKRYIVATEAGILHELQRQCPEKEFIPVPPEISENELADFSEKEFSELSENSERSDLSENSESSELSEQSESSASSRYSSCHCNECQFMKMNTLLKIYNALSHEWPQVEIDPQLVEDAVRPINRMLELS